VAIKIGSISISLTAETSSFQTNMDKASQIALNSSRNIERSFTIMGTAIAAATGSAVGALSLLIDKTQDAVFSMQRMAQQAGTSLETFSKLSYAAKVAGMPTDQLAVIMDRLAHSQYLAAGGSLEQAAAFKALGVNVADSNGKFKDTGSLLIEVAKHLDQFKTSANKTAIETIIMGRSGAQAAELVSVLANRFDDLSETASKLGVVFTEETAQGAQRLHDSMIAIEEAGMGLSVRLLGQVSPALDELAQKIVAMVSNAETMKQVDEFGRELADGIHLAGEAFEFMVQHIQAMKTILEGLVAIRLAGLFGPMIASASEANGVMGKLGLAALNLSGNLLGVRRLGNILAPLAASARDYVTTLGALAAEEGVAGAASIAFADSLAAVKAALSSVAVPIAVITAAVWATTKALEAEKGVAESNAQMAVTWSDMWHGAIDNVKEDFDDLGKIIRAVMTGDVTALTQLKFTRLGDAAAAEARKRQQQEQHGAATPHPANQPTKDMPNVAFTRPNDELQKKLDDLIEKAHAAQRALQLVGAAPQQQRDSEILEKYNEFLVQQKDQLDKLTPAQRSHTELLAHAAIVTQVNTEAAVKYATDLYDLHEALSTSTSDHLAMAAAIGKSAEAMQEAMIQVRLNQEMQKTFGANWRNNPNALNAAKSLGASIRGDINADSQHSDSKTLDGIQQQIDAQLRLNAAILQGAEAKRQAQIANDQAAVRADFAARGDTDTEAMQQQIDMVQRKSDAEKEASDLERAASMSATARYAEQLRAIQDATAAAERYGQALDYREVLAASKQAWVEFEEAQDKAILAAGSMLDGLRVALDQLARDTESDAQMMHDALINAIDSINSALSRSLMAHANSGQQWRQGVMNSLSSASRGIGANLLDTALKKGEGALLKGTGFGKPDGSSQNPWYVRIVGAGAKYSPTGVDVPPTVDVAGWAKSMGLGGGTSAGNTTTSIVASLLRFLPKFADGGDVIPGMPSIIGEQGPELFVPPSAGHIVPNSALRNLGGGDVHFNIDASHSNDPAQTAAMVRQALNEVGPHIAAGAVKMMHERMARRPSSSR
jgi:hypothetical protein